MKDFTIKLMIPFLLMTVFLYGCQPTPPPTPEKIRVALVPAGELGTEGYLFLAGQGYYKASEEFGLEPYVLASEDPEAWESNVRTAAQEGYDLVIGIGSTMQDAVAQVALEFPDTHFALVDAYTGGDNVAGLVSQEQEGTFIAGALAAMMTTETNLEDINEDKVIGFIGGMDIPVVHRFLSGLEQGADYIDPQVRIEVAYVGSFRDPVKAKELALNMFQNQNVDIIYSVAGAAGDQGVFEAVRETGLYAIGSDIDWDSEVSGHILTSVLKRTDLAVYDIIKREVDGEFAAGEIEYGLASEVIDITDMSVMGSKIPRSVRERLEQIKEDIKNGNIQVERRD